MDESKTTPWSTITKAAVSRQEFIQAWQEIGEAGIGSVVACRRVRKLILASEFHRQNLDVTVKEIIVLAAEWSGHFREDNTMPEEKLEEFLTQVRIKLLNIGTIYTIIGAMVGILSVAKDPDVKAEEMKSEEKSQSVGAGA